MRGDGHVFWQFFGNFRQLSIIPIFDVEQSLEHIKFEQKCPESNYSLSNRAKPKFIKFDLTFNLKLSNYFSFHPAVITPNFYQNKFHFPQSPQTIDSFFDFMFRTVINLMHDLLHVHCIQLMWVKLRVWKIFYLFSRRWKCFMFLSLSCQTCGLEFYVLRFDRKSRSFQSQSQFICFYSLDAKASP